MCVCVCVSNDGCDFNGFLDALELPSLWQYIWKWSKTSDTVQHASGCLTRPHTHTLTSSHTHTLTSELGGACDVVDKVAPAMSSVASLPALLQLPKLTLFHLQVPEARVVPRAHARRTVDEVDLPLRRLALL